MMTEEHTPLVPKTQKSVSFRDNSKPLSESSSRSFIEYLTKSERDGAAPGVGAAAFLIRDAVIGDVENPTAQGDYYDPYNHPNAHTVNVIAVACHRICSNRTLRRCILLIAWIMVGLTFVEPPAWCRGENEYAEYDCPATFALHGPPADGSGGSVEYYPNTGTTWITIKASRIIECICVTFMTLFMALKIGRDGISLARFLRKGPTRGLRSLQLAMIASIYIGLISGTTAHHPYARIVLLATFLPGARRDIRLLFKMIPKLFNILFILLVFMLFYAWFGTVMFVDTREGREQFPNLIDSMWTLWICVTTANYPDVMMSSYNENPISAWYFVSFMTMTFFFFMNLVLAAVVNEYQTALDDSQRQRDEMREQNLEKAYALMDPDDTGRIDRDTVMTLFLILNEDFPEFRRLSHEETNLLFAVLDRDGSSTITKDEFKEFGTILLLEFIRTSDYDTFVQRRFPKVFESSSYQRFCSIIKSPYFEVAIDIILVLNAIVIAIQSYPELSGQDVSLDPHLFDGSIDTDWELLETIFTLIYVFEVLAKIMVLGWKAYSESQKNLFDFFITMLAVAATLVVYYPNDYSDSRIVRMVITARVLRLVRLLFAMKRFQLFGMISAEILPLAGNVLLALFFIMYMFSVIGVHLYGGMICRDPRNPYSTLILNATDFSENDYWSNNFNDMFGAMNVLFNLLVVNNWTECEVGFEAVTQGKWVRYFFLSFHIIGVIFVNNLVIAVVINSFLQQLEVLRQRREEERVGDTVIRDRRALFEASEVTGTKTSLRGDFIARFRRSDSSSARDQERLKYIFTRTSSESDK